MLVFITNQKQACMRTHFGGVVLVRFFKVLLFCLFAILLPIEHDGSVEGKYIDISIRLAFGAFGVYMIFGLLGGNFYQESCRILGAAIEYIKTILCLFKVVFELCIYILKNAPSCLRKYKTQQLHQYQENLAIENSVNFV